MYMYIYIYTVYIYIYIYIYMCGFSSAGYLSLAMLRSILMNPPGFIHRSAWTPTTGVLRPSRPGFAAAQATAQVWLSLR